jgi:hypothetical protein
MFLSVSALNWRHTPARIPYSCQDQLGTSGNNGCPIGGDKTVRGIGPSIRHSSIFTQTQTAILLPFGNFNLGLSMMA